MQCAQLISICDRFRPARGRSGTHVLRTGHDRRV